MIKWLFFTTAAILASIGGYLFYYLGAYKEPVIQEDSVPAFHILYKTHVGPYHEINPLIAEVEAWAKDNDIKCPQTFGEYIDDPAQMEPERLMSHGGCIVDEPVPSPAKGMKQRLVPAGKYVVATFDGSPSIGPFKVYPEVYEYAKTQRLALEQEVFEIYTHKGDSFTTRFLFPIKP